MLGDVRDRTIEAIMKFGEKGKLVLSLALELSSRGNELGDFSYKDLIHLLRERGYEYDPKLMLRSLEREFGIIETTYRSSNQHWWKLADKDKIQEVLGIDETEDPDLLVLKAQASSLGLERLEARLNEILRKPRLTEIDREVFKRIAFSDLPLILELLKRSSQIQGGEELGDRLKKIILLAKTVAEKVERDGKGHSGGYKKIQGVEEKNRNDYSIRLPNSKDNL